MATYDLPYAKKHLDELFQEALTVEDVIIVRSDGRSCQLLPVATVLAEGPESEKRQLPDLVADPVAVPAQSATQI